MHFFLVQCRDFYQIFTKYFYIHGPSDNRQYVKSIYLSLYKMRRKNVPMVYEVDTILDECVINYEMHYLIKWKNCDHSYDSWQPVSSLRPVLSYLKDWIKKRQAKLQAKRNEKGQNYKSIKPFLYNGQFLSKKKSKYAKISEEILNRKKTWEKYIDHDERCVQVDEECFTSQERQMKNNRKKVEELLHQNFQRSEKFEQMQENIYYDDEEVDESANIQEQNRMNENPKSIIEQLNDSSPDEHNQLPKTQDKTLVKFVPHNDFDVRKPLKQKASKNKKSDDDCFQVVGSINMKHIAKIVRMFMRGNTRILEIQMRDGKHHFTKQEQVRRANSNMLIEFYQDHNIKF